MQLNQVSHASIDVAMTIPCNHLIVANKVLSCNQWAIFTLAQRAPAVLTLGAQSDGAFKLEIISTNHSQLQPLGQTAWPNNTLLQCLAAL